MITGPLPTPSRVLAIGAHPDDVEFGCGATLARWAGDGAHCEVLVLTDGSKGPWAPAADLAALVATRRAEQLAAAAELGVAHVHFGGAVDGELENRADVRHEVCRVIRSTRPDVVLGHDPWKRYRLHPDHHAAGRLVVDGVVAARDPHFFPDAGAPHRPSTLLLFEAEERDHVEPAGDDARNAKVAALLAHRSQWRSTMGIDEDDADNPNAAQLGEFVGWLFRDGPSESFKLIEHL